MNRMGLFLLFVSLVVIPLTIEAHPTKNATTRAITRAITVAHTHAPARKPAKKGGSDKPIPSLDLLATQFHRANQYEAHLLYGKASAVYQKILTGLLTNAIESDHSNLSMVPREVLPYLFSSAYRLSIANSHVQYSEMIHLITTIDTFKEVDTKITDTLAFGIRLKMEDPTAISDADLSLLYWARAYNTVAWADKVTRGIIWKNYVVLPTQDIADMLARAQKDLSHGLQLRNLKWEDLHLTAKPHRLWLPVTRNSAVDTFQERGSAWLKTQPSSTIQIYSLAFKSSQLDIVARRLAIQDYDQTYQPMLYFTRLRTQKKLKEFSALHTMDEITKSSQTTLFEIPGTMVQLMRIRDSF